MKRNKDYNTKQKTLILNTIKNQKHEFTIKDLYKEFKGEVGLTTIYRFINKLVNDKLLNKTISLDNVTYYQYLKECNQKNHFYLKCDKCGNLIHIDCDCIEDLSYHISQEHGFNPNKENIIINGICKNCLNSKEEK